MPRWLDVIFALGGLIVLAPLMLVIDLVIRLSSSGPALFRQKRVGREGKLFEILKFRTMIVCPVESRGKLTVGNQDARITRVGKLLRKCKLDELPQLLNVLRGEMSFVGPRPEVPEYVELWDGAKRDVVLSVAPGITGPASIVFRNENEILDRVEDPEKFYVQRILPRKLSMNARYLETRTASSDIGMIAETVRRAVMRG